MTDLQRAWSAVYAAAIGAGQTAQQARRTCAQFLADYAEVDPAPSADLVPLYRLQGHGDHFYTTSAAERDAAIAQYGYASEGVACMVTPAT